MSAQLDAKEIDNPLDIPVDVDAATHKSDPELAGGTHRSWTTTEHTAVRTLVGTSSALRTMCKFWPITPFPFIYAAVFARNADDADADADVDNAGGRLATSSRALPTVVAALAGIVLCVIANGVAFQYAACWNRFMVVPPKNMLIASSTMFIAALSIIVSTNWIPVIWSAFILQGVAMAGITIGAEAVFHDAACYELAYPPSCIADEQPVQTSPPTLKENHNLHHYYKALSSQATLYLATLFMAMQEIRWPIAWRVFVLLPAPIALAVVVSTVFCPFLPRGIKKRIAVKPSYMDDSTYAAWKDGAGTTGWWRVTDGRVLAFGAAQMMAVWMVLSRDHMAVKAVLLVLFSFKAFGTGKDSPVQMLPRSSIRRHWASFLVQFLVGTTTAMINYSLMWQVQILGCIPFNLFGFIPLVVLAALYEMPDPTALQAPQTPSHTTLKAQVNTSLWPRLAGAVLLFGVSAVFEVKGLKSWAGYFRILAMLICVYLAALALLLARRLNTSFSQSLAAVLDQKDQDEQQESTSAAFQSTTLTQQRFWRDTGAALGVLVMVIFLARLPDTPRSGRGQPLVKMPGFTFDDLPLIFKQFGTVYVAAAVAAICGLIACKFIPPYTLQDFTKFPPAVNEQARGIIGSSVATAAPVADRVSAQPVTIDDQTTTQPAP